MIYVSHAWPHAINKLADQLRFRGYEETHSFSSITNRYELITDAPMGVVEQYIFDTTSPREALERAYEVKEI